MDTIRFQDLLNKLRKRMLTQMSIRKTSLAEEISEVLKREIENLERCLLSEITFLQDSIPIGLETVTNVGKNVPLNETAFSDVKEGEETLLDNIRFSYSETDDDKLNIKRMQLRSIGNVNGATEAPFMVTDLDDLVIREVKGEPEDFSDPNFGYDDGIGVESQSDVVTISKPKRKSKNKRIKEAKQLEVLEDNICSTCGYISSGVLNLEMHMKEGHKSSNEDSEKAKISINNAEIEQTIEKFKSKDHPNYKRPRNPDKWLRNARKTAHQSGQAYINARGVYREARRTMPVDCSTCKYKCQEQINEERRFEICNEFWSLGDYKLKKTFLAAHLKISDVVTRTLASDKFKKGYSVKYSFKNSENVKKRVCRKFFIKTLNISGGQISDKIMKVNDVWVFDTFDNRGRQTPTNKGKQPRRDRRKNKI